MAKEDLEIRKKTLKQKAKVYTDESEMPDFKIPNEDKVSGWGLEEDINNFKKKIIQKLFGG